MNGEKMILNGKEIDIDKIRALISENRKLEAVKFVMDQANIGLSQAKDFVDDLIERRESPTADDEVLKEMKNLLKKNQKIEAIKLAKTSTGMDLKESKDFVENIDEMDLEDLLSAFKGKSLSSFSSNIQTLNSKGEIKNIHSFDSSWNSGGKKEEKKSNFDDRASGNKTKTIILVVAGIVAVLVYFYNR